MGDPTKPSPRPGDVVTLDEGVKTEYVIVEVLGPHVKPAKRRAFEIRKSGGQCSYRKMGGAYCILRKQGVTPPEYFLK